jgi:hypothetical protein
LPQIYYIRSQLNEPVKNNRFALLAASLFLMAALFSCHTQFKTIRNHTGFFVSTHDGAVKMYLPRDTFYELKSHETVLSIGAESGANEVIYGLLTDSMHFDLENISAKYLEQASVDFSLEYYQKLFDKKSTSTTSIHIGNDSSTLLPAASYQKVLIENSLHEFSAPKQMMEELYRIVKPGGAVYIFERMSTPRHPIHQSCGKRLFSEAELTTLMQEAHFRIEKTALFEQVNLFKFSKQ